MPTVDEMRAALKVAELEEKLIAAKGDGSIDGKLRLKLRQARQEYRELRAARPPEPGEVRPDAVKASAKVKE